MEWYKSHHFDPIGAKLADRHYSRKTPGSPQFCPPGRRVVLIKTGGDAVWITSWPYAHLVAHAYPGAWVNTLFRNESDRLSSELIQEAVAVTRYFWNPPDEGLITFVDARKIRSTNPGYCYLMAGFRKIGRAKGGQLVLHLGPEDMPDAAAPYDLQAAMF